MAEVRLSDVIIPELYNAEVALRMLEKSAVFMSGLVTNSATLGTFAAGNYGQLVHLPQFNPISKDESSISSDDPADLITPLNITESDMRALKNMRAQAWSSMDLVNALASADPLSVISNQVGDYWAYQYDQAGINILNGVIADNVTNDGSDMVVTIGTDDVGAPAAAELISAGAVIDAQATAGDTQDDFTIIVMHSVPYAELRRQNVIEFIQPSDGVDRVPMYGNMRVVVSDNCPAVAGANRTIYDTYLASEGVIGYGQGSPKVPSEVERIAGAGGGEGQETLHDRKHFIMHPIGFDWTATKGSGYVGQSPTFAELAVAANWNRIYERKRVRLAVLRTNG